MSKNRKSQAAAIRFGSAAKVILFCLLIGGAGLGYVWQQKQIYELSRQFTRRERTLQQLRETNLNRQNHLAVLRSEPELEKRARELSLGLIPPQQRQIITIIEPGPAASSSAPARASTPRPGYRSPTP